MTEIVDLCVSVEISITDESILDRGSEPSFYTHLDSREAMLRHLANFAVLGYNDISELDGFIDRGIVTMQLIDSW